VLRKGRFECSCKPGRIDMINFDEEIGKFQPSLEIEQAEDVINNNDLTDISDILKELLKGNKEN
jgi:hypothetical protein